MGLGAIVLRGLRASESGVQTSQHSAFWYWRYVELIKSHELSTASSISAACGRPFLPACFLLRSIVCQPVFAHMPTWNMLARYIYTRGLLFIVQPLVRQYSRLCCTVSSLTFPSFKVSRSTRRRRILSLDRDHGFATAMPVGIGALQLP